MIKIELDNNGMLEMEYKNNWTVVTIKDSKGYTINCYGIENNDLVMLLDYYRNQLEDGLPIFKYEED
jgi:hypothetical protein